MPIHLLWSVAVFGCQQHVSNYNRDQRLAEPNISAIWLFILKSLLILAVKNY